MDTRFRVLVTDDDRVVRRTIVRILRDYAVEAPEYDARVAFDLEEAEAVPRALELIQDNPPVLLLLDYIMPGMTGLDALACMAERGLKVPTVMITGHASIEVAVSATKHGAQEFVTKPFTAAELRAVVRKTVLDILTRRQTRALEAERRRVRFRFLSVLAHELKAPLSAIEGYLMAVQRRSAGDDPAVYQQMLDRCLVRTEYMEKMIADLLDLTCIESGEKGRHLEEVELSAVLTSCVETVAPTAEAHGITIELRADTPVTLCADRRELEVIFCNLISNAEKYNCRGGHIAVSLARDGGGARIQVSDTGIGMSREERGKLFQDFVRIKNEKTKDVLGSGLGLSTVKKLVQLYGGEVTVESEPDVGSTFTVHLKNGSPAGAIAEDLPAAAAKASELGSTPPTGPHR